VHTLGRFRIVLKKLPINILDVQGVQESFDYSARDYDGEGVYRTNVPPWTKAKEESVRINNNIDETVNDMFDGFSSPSDLRCDCHKNGVLNILYGLSVPNESNRYVKGNIQEAQLAMLQENWDKCELKTSEMYFGPSIHIN
jgi:hypothetical protein